MDKYIPCSDKEVEKAITALYLEVEASVAENIHVIVRKAINERQALLNEIKEKCEIEANNIHPLRSLDRIGAFQEILGIIKGENDGR